MNTTFLGILVGLCGVLFGIIAYKDKKISKLKNESKTNKQTAEVAEKRIEEVEDVQKKLKDLEKNSTPPEEVPTPSTGDSQSRLDRLNKLHNN